MSAGKVFEEELCLKAVALLCVVTGEEENEEEERDLFVAAALSKIDAGVALLVREVYVALLCFYSRRRNMCICCLCSRVLSPFRNRTRPLKKEYVVCLYHNDC